MINESMTEEMPSARTARWLEIKLLIASMTAFQISWPWETWAEELAIHFSVDVSIPAPFLRWLHRLGSQRGNAILEILGMEDDPEEGREDQTLIVPCYSAERRPATEGTEGATPNKRRRLSSKQDRFRIEVDSPTAVLFNHGGTPKASQDAKTNHRNSIVPRKKYDQTLILETPPRLTFAISRSSTPGCSQRINNLSLDDD